MLSCTAAFIARLRAWFGTQTTRRRRRDPDQADTDRNLGSHAEEIVERLQPHTRGVRVVAAHREPAHELVEQRECVTFDARLLHRRGGLAERVTAKHSVDVDAAQPEDICHAHLRGDPTQGDGFGLSRAFWPLPYLRRIAAVCV